MTCPRTYRASPNVSDSLPRDLHLAKRRSSHCPGGWETARRISRVTCAAKGAPSALWHSRCGGFRKVRATRRRRTPPRRHSQHTCLRGPSRSWNGRRAGCPAGFGPAGRVASGRQGSGAQPASVAGPMTPPGGTHELPTRHSRHPQATPTAPPTRPPMKATTPAFCPFVFGNERMQAEVAGSGSAHLRKRRDSENLVRINVR
jgi:hypothetical protein